MMNPLRDVWQSVFRRDPLSTDKGKSELVFLNVWLHIHPAKVKKENLKVKHTFYLGFITFVLFLILVTTGVALMFYYRPNPPQAYQDMKDLQFVVYLGSFLRNMRSPPPPTHLDGNPQRVPKPSRVLAAAVEQ